MFGTTTENKDTDKIIGTDATTTTAVSTTNATSEMPSLKRDVSLLSHVPVKKLKKKTVSSLADLPEIDNSIFSSDDFLDAIGENTDNQPVADAPSAYASMGVGTTMPPRDAPIKPDCTLMSPRSEKRAMDAYMSKKLAYQRDKKAQTDALLKERRKAAGGRAIHWADIEYSGDNTPTLRTRDLVLASRLEAGHNIVDKEYLKIRVAEEAMLRGIDVRWKTSTNSRMVVVGDRFLVSANLNEKEGWIVKEANIRSGDDQVGELDEVADDEYYEDDEEIDDNEDEEDVDDDDKQHDEDDGGAGDEKKSSKKKKERKLRTPLSSDWIVPLIKDVISVKPNTSNADLRHILRSYCRKYALTRGLLQKARDKARLEIFGNPLINVAHFKVLAQELVFRGNHVEIVTANRNDAVKRLQMVVLADEIRRRKEKGEPVLLNDKSEAKLFLQLWMQEHRDFVTEHFGSDDTNYEFVVGILFAPGTATQTVRHLQNVYQADAAHLQFGKYTAYGSTANSNASPVAFAILFGNEDTSNWVKFWTFAKSLHPHLDNGAITIITDQDKGSDAAVSRVLPHAVNFHCSWHRRGNIIKVRIFIRKIYCS